MERIFTIATVFLAILFVSSCSQWGHSNAASPETASSENIEQVLTSLTAEWSKVNFSHDTSVLERILAPDMIFTGDDPERLSDGFVWGKQELIAYDKKDGNTYSSAAARNVKVRVFDADFAVSTGDYRVAGIDQNGKAFDRTARFTNVWAMRNGSWQVVAGHNNWLPARN